MNSNEQQYLIPKSGLVVIDPATGKPLPSQGAYVPVDPYWHRRLLDGDVTQGAAPAVKAAQSKTTKE